MNTPSNERAPLRLDRNEGAPPPPELMGALGELCAAALARYPDPTDAIGGVERAWAERLGVDPARVVLTTGGDGAIDLFFARFGSPGARCVLAAPTFEPIVAAAVRARMELAELDGFARRYPIDEAASLLRDRADRLVLVTPNNPTGLWLDEPTLDALLGVANGRPTLVDLAYREFCPVDPTQRVLEAPGACALVSLSKAWGLAGLRVGCLVAPAELAAELRATRPVYPVAVPSLLLARAALEDFGDLPGRNADRAVAMRERVTRLLVRAGLEPLPSGGNFVLARGAGAGDLAAGLAERGVRVRRFDGRDDLADAVRVTCPTDDDALARLVLEVDALCRARELELAGGAS